MDRPGLHSGPSLERIPLPVVLVDTTKEGFLFIRKHNGEWKKYWFVLGRTALCYYRREKELRPVGQIAMDNVTLECRVNEWATKSAAYCFQITHPERPTTFLASATLTERLEWLKSLHRARLMQKPEAPPAPPKLDFERAGFKDDDSTETDTEDEREEDDDPATLASALSAAILASPPTSPRIEMAPPLLGSVDSNTSVTSSSSSLSTASSLSSAASAGAPGVGAAQLASAFSLATQAASSAGPAPALFSSAQAAKLHRPRTFSFTGEKLIVAYRYMKQGLTGQTSPPSVIYIPSNNIYRRFTFNVAIQKLLKSYPSLNTLNITDCKFGGDFELEYIEICQKNPSLTNLEFRNTSGKRNVHDSLFSVVSKLPIHIRSLTLDNILSKDGVSAVLQVLQTRQQITSIDLSNNPFYTPQMTVLIKCLSSTYLEHINLTGCSVSDEQACLLFAALAENQTVGSLNLSHNHISRPSVEHIAQFLHGNRNLTSLNLAHNKLRRVDIIFSALSGTNQKELQVLNLEDNKIGHASVYALCKFLQYNHSLTDLNLANNKFREDDGKMILMALPQNRTLQQFKLSRTNKALGVISVGIAAKDAEAIEEILDRNRIESVQMNRGNGDKRRTFGNFQKDYSEYLVQLMQMLCVPHALADIEKKAEYQQCLDFARACLEKGYDEYKVDEFTRNSHFKYVIGQNVTFLKHAAYLLALVGEIRLRLQHLSTLEATKEGYLFKRGGRRKNWKKRYFSLNGLFVFYYVNHQQRTKRKGIIVLEEASIRLGSVHGMMAKYAFEVVTPNRIWILCCDSAEDMDAWVDAIQKVKEVQANKVLKSQLEEIKNGVAAFAGVYDTYNIKYPDPHRKWILQWWFPQCLEVLAFSILGEKQEAAAAVEGTGNGTNSGREKLSASTSSLESSLSREGKTSLSSSSSRLSSGRRERNFIDKLINQFVVNSGIAFYLLTGDYLFDDKMVRSVDGVFQPSLTLANHYKHIQFQHENMQRLQHLKSAVHESLRSSVAKGPFDQQSVNALMQSYSAFKSAQSPETPHKRPMMILNTLTQCLDLQGVLYTILNELSDTVLNQLLFLNKHSIREISSQYSDMPSDGAEKNVSVRTVMAAWRMSTRYQFVPYLSDPEDFIFFDLHNLPSDPGKAQKMMHASVGHMRAADDFLVSLMCCSGLQSLQKPMERLLVAIHWLKMHWPGEEKQLFAMDERDSSMAVRLAFIVRAFLAPVKEAHISMHNLDVYDYWTEFCRLATDVVSHIALSARQGISKQHLQEPLELMTTMCTEAVRELVLTLYAPPPASGVEGVAGSQILHAARKY